jgi:hypothetical protein
MGNQRWLVTCAQVTSPMLAPRPASTIDLPIISVNISLVD